MRAKEWFVAAALCGASVQSAFGFDWLSRAKLDYHRMNCWPAPFAQADQELTRAPFAAMEAKGWQRQNTLGDEYFDQENQQLTRSGELKVRWILTQAPESRRSVFVLRGMTDEATAARLDAVQLATARMVGQGQMPEILATNTPSPGWPADYVNDIDTKVKATTPSPRLPTQEASSGSGG